MSKKTGYTLEQHEHLGKELYAMNERLLNIKAELSHAYPQRIYNDVELAVDALRKLRNTLDECLHRENPEGSKPIRCYFRANLPEEEQ